MIRPATAADAVAMAAVEAEARALLEAQGVHFDRLDLPEGFSEEMTWDLAVVAQELDRVVGMARCSALTPTLLRLDQVSVSPAWSHRGIGSALLATACDLARAAGYDQVTGTTFADVAFNAPFYRRLGAREDAQPHPEMVRRRKVERDLGLDQFGRRIIMRMDLGREDQAAS